MRFYVRTQEENAEIIWKQTLLQALVTGKEGFDTVNRMFRQYQESLSPWLAVEREREERKLVERVSRFIRVPALRVREVPGRRRGSRG